MGSPLEISLTNPLILGLLFSDVNIRETIITFKRYIQIMAEIQ